MKYLSIASAALFASLAFFANATATNGGYGGSSPMTTPYAPCYVNNEYVGTIEITYCRAQHGTFTKQKYIKY